MLEVEVLFNRAQQLEKEGQSTAAWNCYQEIVQKDPNHFPSLYRIAGILFKQKKYEESAKLFQHLTYFQPYNSDLWYRAGLCYAKTDDPQAILCFRKVLKIHPKKDHKARNIAFLNLAKALKKDEQYEEAKKIATVLTKKEPSNASAYNLLGQLAQYDGANEEALISFQKVIELKPENAEANLNIGVISMIMNKPEEAKKYLQKAISLRPQWPAPYRELALCWQYDSNTKKTVELLSHALSLDPKDIDSLRKLSHYYIHQGDHKKSIDYNKMIISLAPDDWDAQLNLGSSYTVLGYSKGSLPHFQKAYTLKPETRSAFAIANVYNSLKDFENADLWYRKTLEHDPEHFSAIYNTIFRKMEYCDWTTRKEDEEILSSTLEKHLNSTSYDLPIPALFFNYFDLPMQTHRRLNEFFDKDIKNKLEVLSKQVDFKHHPSDRKILHVGYISPDFRDHPVGRLVADLFKHHNRDHVKVFVYTLTPYSADDVYSIAIKEGCDVYRDCSFLSNVETAQRIYDDEIDILVDLAGHTAYKRSEIIGLQAAPVQLHMIGYPDTMGMKSIQYILADKHLAPQHLSAYYTEEIYHLPSCFIGRKAEYKGLSLTRADVGLPDDAFVYAGFNRSSKIEPQLFQSWMNILRAVNKGVLWLSEMPEQAQNNLLKVCQESGLDPKRIIFSSKRDYEVYIQSHQFADLFLDTWHYSAGSTAIAALGAGLAVLTVIADNNASRMGGSIVAAAGLTDLICYDLEAYEKKAVELARNPGLLKKYSAILNSSIDKTLLFNYPQFASNLELAFENIYQKWKIEIRNIIE